MWTNAKTDWKSTDFYNISDYERIRDNILWIKQLADSVIDKDTVIAKTYTYNVPTLTNMADKEYSDITYASVLNTVENNFALINANTHEIADERNTFESNGAFYSHIQLNELEEMIQLLHDWLLWDMSGMRKTGFTLANSISQKGVLL